MGRNLYGEVSEMTFVREKYIHGGEVHEQELWLDVSEFIQLCMKNDKVCKVRDEGVCVVVEFAHDESVKCYGGPVLVWLRDDECELIADYNYEKEKDE